MNSKAIFAITILSISLFSCPECALASNQAIVIGPTYPGGSTFDDTIAQTRANQISQSIIKWGNWDATDINTLTAGVTCSDILDAIRSAASNLEEDEIFLLIYHGHGSYSTAEPKDENEPPAQDTCDESLWLGLNCLDDSIASAMATLPESVYKFVVLASCYSGGFWNGDDDPGDLENLSRICLLAGASECTCLPEPSTFVNNLLSRTDPAGWPDRNCVSFNDFIQAVTDGASGSVTNSNRWADELDKCPCAVDDDPLDIYDFFFFPVFQISLNFLPWSMLFESADPVPTAPYILPDSIRYIEQGQNEAIIPFTICNMDVCVGSTDFSYDITSSGYIGPAVNKNGSIEVNSGECEDVYISLDSGDAVVCGFDIITMIAWNTDSGTAYDTCVMSVHVVEPLPVSILTVQVTVVLILLILVTSALLLRNRRIHEGK